SRCCSRESTVLSRMAAKAPILIWNKGSREHREKSPARRHRFGGVDLYRAMVVARARPARGLTAAAQAAALGFRRRIRHEFLRYAGHRLFRPDNCVLQADFAPAG